MMGGNLIWDRVGINRKTKRTFPEYYLKNSLLCIKAYTKHHVRCIVSDKYAFPLSCIYIYIWMHIESVNALQVLVISLIKYKYTSLYMHRYVYICTHTYIYIYTYIINNLFQLLIFIYKKPFINLIYYSGCGYKSETIQCMISWIWNYLKKHWTNINRNKYFIVVVLNKFIYK